MTDWGKKWREFEGSFLYALFYLTDKTAKFEVIGDENIALAEASGKPIMWSLWHQQVACYMHYAVRFREKENFIVIIAGDWRGDVLERLGSSIGSIPLRIDMSDNPVASGRSVLKVIKEMKKGRESFLAPDGPVGPVFTPRAGVAFIAQKAEAAVLPIGVWTKNGFQMRRWDRYIYPFPFAKFYVSIGEPIYPERKQPTDEFLGQITEANHVQRMKAMEMAGVTPTRNTH